MMRGVAASAAGAALLAACARGPAASGATVTSASTSGAMPNEDAVSRLANARCDRERACDEIGSGRAFDDEPSCLAEMGELVDEEAGRSVCTAGVDALAVARCELDVRRGPCGDELESATGVPSCVHGALCHRN